MATELGFILSTRKRQRHFYISSKFFGLLKKDLCRPPHVFPSSESFGFLSGDSSSKDLFSQRLSSRLNNNLVA